MESVLQQEEWKDIEGYEGFYQVSNLGRVRSIAATKSLGWHRITKVIFREKILATQETSNGYLVVYLTCCGKRKRAYVHRLVADAFCEKLEGRKEINHIDFNRQNNNANNLEWCNHKENMRASSAAGRMNAEKSICKPSNTGEKHITYRQSKGLYRVSMVGFKEKSFKNLESAIAYRDAVKRKRYESANERFNR